MFALNQLLPFLFERSQMRTTRTRISVRNNKIENGTLVDPTWEKFRALDTGILQDSLRVELSRREYVHRRAQTFMSVIAVMTAFTIGATNILRLPRHIIPSWAMALGVLFAFLYLAIGGWYALQTIRPGQLHDFHLQNRMKDDRPLDENELKDMLLSLIQMNQAQSLIFSTLAERTYRSVRNGVLLLGAVLLVLVIDSIATIDAPNGARTVHTVPAAKAAPLRPSVRP